MITLSASFLSFILSLWPVNSQNGRRFVSSAVLQKVATGLHTSFGGETPLPGLLFPPLNLNCHVFVTTLLISSNVFPPLLCWQHSSPSSLSLALLFYMILISFFSPTSTMIAPTSVCASWSCACPVSLSTSLFLVSFSRLV